MSSKVRLALICHPPHGCFLSGSATGFITASYIMRRNLIGAARVRAAMDSLEEPTHHIDVARWIVSFLSHSVAKGDQ